MGVCSSKDPVKTTGQVKTAADRSANPADEDTTNTNTQDVHVQDKTKQNPNQGPLSLYIYLGLICPILELFLPWQAEGFGTTLEDIVYEVYCILAASKRRSAVEKAIPPLPQEAPPVTVEAVVCKVDELKHGEMKEFEIGGKKILLANEHGEFYALGTKCTHYGAPLVKGVLCNGRIRCPFHGACFSLATGDIEDYPGLDSIPKYSVAVEDGVVKVKTTEKQLELKKRVKKMTCGSPEDETVCLIIGGGPASVVCAETLRQEGYKGSVILATRELHYPYDRIKLSKSLDVQAENIVLRERDFYSVYDITIKLGKEAVSVDTTLCSVKFSDGQSISYDKLLIATGGSPRTLDLPGEDFTNVFYLRTPDDANDIAKASKDRNVVIIGNSFIAMEIAAYMASKAKSVRVLSRSEIPFKATFGEQVGSIIKQMHLDKGTQFTTGTPEEFIGTDGRLTGIKLRYGSTIEADVCLVAIGVVPSTSFLIGSGINTTPQGHVIVDKNMRSNVSSVFAAGDVTYFPLSMIGDECVNIGHWQLAHTQGRTAGLSMSGNPSSLESIPFFWTVQFGKSIRFAGYNAGYDDVIVHGDLKTKFAAFYFKQEKVIAVATMNFDPLAAQVAELIRSGKLLYKHDVRDDPTEWTKRFLYS